MGGSESGALEVWGALGNRESRMGALGVLAVG